ncbi:MAG: hypothetical protein KDE56_28635 [Anaerolineales bacterium]|nr:hypothetical protein [Anaerolineales bacterium]
MSTNLHLSITIQSYQLQHQTAVSAAVTHWLQSEGLQGALGEPLFTRHPKHGPVLQTSTPHHMPVIISRSYAWLPEAQQRLQTAVVAANEAPCIVQLTARDADEPTSEGLIPDALLPQWRDLAAQSLDREMALDRFGHDERLCESIEAELTRLRHQQIALSGILSIALQDIPNAFVGGTHFTLMAENGRCAIENVQRDGFSQKYEGWRSLTDITQLIGMMDELSFRALANPARPGTPDEARPEIHVHFQSGETLIRWKWANDPHFAFDRIYKRLLDLARIRPNDSLQP